MDISDLLNTPPKFIDFTENDLLEKFEKYNLPHLGGGSHKKTFNGNILKISHSQLNMDGIQLISIPFSTLCAPTCVICLPPCTFVCHPVPLAS
jgi:hypothetical protein